MSTQYIHDYLSSLQTKGNSTALQAIRAKALNDFKEKGIPTSRHEEWKYTRISSVFNKEYKIAPAAAVSAADMEAYKLPGSAVANELVFVNGVFSKEASVVRSASMHLSDLETAMASSYNNIIEAHFNHSADYIYDGILAMNTAQLEGALFIAIDDNAVVEEPVYLYNIVDNREEDILAQPRTLIYIGKNVQVNLVETCISLGDRATITNQVCEIVADTGAHVTLCKIQNDKSIAHQVNTCHVRQIGKNVVSVITISLDGGIVRNNLQMVMEAPHCESHMYGLYMQDGNSHIDNHTVVDNVVPNCESNEMYKGIMSGASTGVFNGKIFVRKDAQKTNAFQSNKNVLLSEEASVNTKPQLEIFADDVKCSHGCTVGALDEEGLFYIQSRGIPKKAATALLLKGFAMDILEQIPSEPIKEYVEHIIAERMSN